MTTPFVANASAWPDIPYAAWRETCSALHLYSQIVGKYRLAHTPWVNHSWHATFYVTPRGLTTSVIPDGAGVEVLFDLRDQQVVAESADGTTKCFPLGPMSVADFLARFKALVRSVGGTPELHGSPNEIPDPVPFADDRTKRPWDAKAVRDFHRTLLVVERVLRKFRTGFIGKVSPVHLFWGSFDLAVTRFSGRTAPPHPGGFPALPDAVTREAYSHEVSSAGFWPGGGPIEEAAFYSYAYPEPDGFASASVQPEAAFYAKEVGEFILPYQAVRTTDNPERTLLAFLQSTYEAAANLGDWPRDALECPIGRPRTPRPLPR